MHYKPNAFMYGTSNEQNMHTNSKSQNNWSYTISSDEGRKTINTSHPRWFIHGDVDIQGAVSGRQWELYQVPISLNSPCWLETDFWNFHARGYRVMNTTTLILTYLHLHVIWLWSKYACLDASKYTSARRLHWLCGRVNYVHQCTQSA